MIVALVACSTSGLTELDPALPLLDPGPDAIDGEFIIEAKLTDEEMEQLGLVRVAWNKVLGMGLYQGDGEASALQFQLGGSARGGPRVEPNRVRALSADPYRSLQWNFDVLDVEAAWALGGRGEGATVAVIDSGVSLIGEDAPAHRVAGWDFVDGDGDPSDENGHGTHVAGTIAQATDNGRGVAGVAPNADIMAVRVMDASGSGSAWDVAEGITFAADGGADVLNLSIGSASSTSVESAAVAHAVGLGVVVVAASGNSGAKTVDYPAAYPGVLAVGATRVGDTLAPYSNTGSALDLVAPGGDLNRDSNGDGYADGVLQETLDGRGTAYLFFEGTSMASPHVAAAAALLIGAGADRASVPGLLTGNARNLLGTGWDKSTGWGRVDPVAALEALPTAPPPADDAPAGDTSAPVISGVDGWRSGSTLIVWWTTNEPTGSWIEFDGYGTFGDGALVTSHELSFTIASTSTYVFTVLAEDAAGNASEDGPWSSSP